MRSRRLEVRLTARELAAWREAAGDRGVAALVRTAVEKEIQARQAAQLEAATADDEDPLAQLDRLIRS